MQLATGVAAPTRLSMYLLEKPFVDLVFIAVTPQKEE
jgi:hypothetical protein